MTIPTANGSGRIPHKLVWAGVGGVVLPVLYVFMLQAVAILLSHWYSYTDRFVDPLAFPLVWPMRFYDWIFPLPPLASGTLMVSRDEFPRTEALLVMVLWDFLFCSFLTYALLRWWERIRRRRAQAS